MKTMSTDLTKRDSARQSALEVARGIVDGTTTVLEGCRSLVRLRADAEIPRSEAFCVIIGVESETDDYPVGNQRASYAPELLERLDAQVLPYLDEVRPAVVEACGEIIREIETLNLQSCDGALQ